MQLPSFYHIHQNFSEDPRVSDIEAAVHEAVFAAGISGRLKPGARIAITGGSRGIGRMPEILQATGKALRELGASPFVITAMGSHGGGTPEGQLAVLEEYGITESSVDMPVRSTMDTTEIGRTPAGVPVYMDDLARGADGVFLVNRIKKHTDFHGPIESGLCKMMALGLGKVKQANLIHANRPKDFPAFIESIAKVMIGTGKILGGLGIIENRAGLPAQLCGVPAEAVPDKEKELLKESYKFFPSLPFDEAELVIVRKMGKDISGGGMDPNVLGRLYIEGEMEPAKPFLQIVGVLELTHETDGNAVGLGFADLTTRRLLESIDAQKTNLNGLTSNFLRRMKTPFAVENDQELLETALSCVQGPFRNQPRIALIQDTLHLDDLLVSESLMGSLHDNGLVVKEAVELNFDSQGNISYE